MIGKRSISEKAESPFKKRAKHSVDAEAVAESNQNTNNGTLPPTNFEDNRARLAADAGKEIASSRQEANADANPSAETSERLWYALIFYCV